MAGPEEVLKELSALLDYHPRPAKRDEDHESPFSLPVLFYDRHIDSKFELKRVVSLPSLAEDLAAVVHREIHRLKEDGHNLPALLYVDDNGNAYSAFIKKYTRKNALINYMLLDAFSVFNRYNSISFRYCSGVGSTLALHPYTRTWYSVLHFVESSNVEYRAGYLEDFSLQLSRDTKTGELSLVEGLMKELIPESLTLLRYASRRYPKLATYQFYSPLDEYHALLKDINFKKTIAPYKPLVTGCIVPITPMPFSPDGISTALLAHQNQPMRHSSRIRFARGKNCCSAAEDTPIFARANHFPDVTVKVKQQKNVKSDTTIFIQHAWARAVMDDSTFIIFHSGDYERIGIRHRGSGTLYLSGLIDVNRGHPAYGVLQVGLYMAIIRDVLDRASQCMKTEPTTSSRSTKRKRETQESMSCGGTVKCRKTRSAATSSVKIKSLQEEAKKNVLHKTNERLLALMRLTYDAFNSSAPAAFIRAGHAATLGVPCSQRIMPRPDEKNRPRKFKPSEYFEINLTAGGPAGATGKIHRATISIEMADGQLQSCEAVAKIAFLPDQRTRLRHEYDVYIHLWKHGVKVIPIIYGLFEDAADEATLLVMNNVGISLHDREPDSNDGQVIVTTEEAEAFKHALTSVHQAGVRHYDIRPMNLMIDNDGKAYIVDFDMAKIGAGQHSRQREFDDLCSLLNGDYIPPNQIPSVPTTAQRSPSATGSS